MGARTEGQNGAVDPRACLNTFVLTGENLRKVQPGLTCLCHSAFHILGSLAHVSVAVITIAHYTVLPAHGLLGHFPKIGCVKEVFHTFYC